MRPFTINHVELIYPEGGRDAARAVLELLGCTVVDVDQWMLGLLNEHDFPDVIDADAIRSKNMIDDLVCVSEIIPAHQAYEDAYAAVLESNPSLGESFDHWREVRATFPPYNFHYGFSIPTYEKWEELIESIREAGENHPLLKGKIEVVTTYGPGLEHEYSLLHQAFIRTSALAQENLRLGWQFELQYAHVREDGVPDSTLVTTPINLKTLV